MKDEKLLAFLREFSLSDAQIREVYKRFCAEIAKGLRKATHAQADTKCFVTYVQDLPTGEEVGNYLALDLGGTNFRVLLVSLKGHHDAAIDSEIYAIPKSLMIGHGDKLFDHIAKCLATFVQNRRLNSSRLPLGFTFSFPCQQLGLTKALLERWTKGFQCEGVVKQDVVQLLKEAIARRGDVEIDVMAVLNDATGTLMSCAHRNAECRIGVIIGTGCNACFVERVENAELLEPEFKKNKKHVLINAEWGAFGDGGALKIIRTKYDDMVDKLTLNAGYQLFEKMISGMYLGELVRLVLHDAIAQDLIFQTHSNKANLLSKLSREVGCFETRCISEIEEDKYPDFSNAKTILKQLFDMDNVTAQDARSLRIICEAISKRAATLVAIGLSGLTNRINEPKVVVGVDGSVYRFHPHFDKHMRENMRELIEPHISFDLMLSEDGSGRGAALVAAVASQN